MAASEANRLTEPFHADSAPVRKVWKEEREEKKKARQFIKLELSMSCSQPMSPNGRARVSQLLSRNPDVPSATYAHAFVVRTPTLRDSGTPGAPFLPFLFFLF